MVEASTARRSVPAWIMRSFWCLMVILTAYAGIELLMGRDAWLAVLTLPVLMNWIHLRGEFFRT